MTNEFITIKTTKKALRLIRTVCACTSEKQYEMLERILKEELEQIKDD